MPTVSATPHTRLTVSSGVLKLFRSLRETSGDSDTRGDLCFRAVTIELGLKGEATMVVGADETAFFQGTGDADVLSTPRLLQLMQEATMDALADNLPDGMMTAGLRVNLDHLHSSRIGTEVTANATLTRIEGRRLVFEAEAHALNQLVGTGRIIRVQIDRERFLANL